MSPFSHSPPSPLSRWLPAESPLNDPLVTYAFCASLVLQYTLFHVLSATLYAGSDAAQLKKRCWILTTFNGFVTTLVATPYLVDLFASGFDLHSVQPRVHLTHAACAFFIAYLLSDLGLGSIYYRHLINLSSGWVHHTVYTGLFAFWVHKGWAHIAVMACVFELPTFIMGIASMHPRLRSNVAFTSTFLLTRVVFHIALLCSTVTPHGRAAPGIDGSWGPCISVAATLPMHLWWGYKCVLSVRRRMHKRKLAAKAEREKQANAFANIAAQAFNGFQSPDASSAVNTPLPTPGPSPVLSAVSPGALQGAFAKAAAATRRPMELVLNRRRSGGGVATQSIPDIALGPLNDAGDSPTAAVSSSAVPLRSSHATSRPSLQGRRASTSDVPRAAAAPAPPFTAPVRPHGATPDSREPFLAIRSAAEARDRARRLVADAVRRLWNGAPETWRVQFEEEARLMELRRAQPRRARQSLAEPSDRSDTEWEFEAEAEGGSGDGSVSDAGADPAELRRSAEKRTRGQRARAMLRRGVLRAVRRAINGGDENGSDDSSSSSSVSVADGADADAARARATTTETDRALRNLDLTTLLKLSGLPLPPDLVGQPYVVRPLNMEKREGERSRRIVGDLRRKMEVRARDVVVWD